MIREIFHFFRYGPKVQKRQKDCNRKTEEVVQVAGFIIRTIESYKIYSNAAPATFSFRIIKAQRPA